MFDSKRDFQEAHNRFMRGDAIDDAELETFESYYSRLNKTLEAIDDQSFKLFQDEIRSRWLRLADYKTARKEKCLREVFRVNMVKELERKNK